MEMGKNEDEMMCCGNSRLIKVHGFGDSDRYHDYDYSNVDMFNDFFTCWCIVSFRNILC